MSSSRAEGVTESMPGEGGGIGVVGDGGSPSTDRMVGRSERGGGIFEFSRSCFPASPSCCFDDFLLDMKELGLKDRFMLPILPPCSRNKVFDSLRDEDDCFEPPLLLLLPLKNKIKYLIERVNCSLVGHGYCYSYIHLIIVHSSIIMRPKQPSLWGTDHSGRFCSPPTYLAPGMVPLPCTLPVLLLLPVCLLWEKLNRVAVSSLAGVPGFGNRRPLVPASDDDLWNRKIISWKFHAISKFKFEIETVDQNERNIIHVLI